MTTIEEHFKNVIEAEVGQYDNLFCLWQNRKALVFTAITESGTGGQQVGEMSVTPGWSGGGGYCYGFTLACEWLPGMDDGTWTREERSVRFDKTRGTQRPTDDFWLNVFEAGVQAAVAEMAQHV